MFAASKSGKPAASGAATDPNFNNTVLLLETTGTNGQQNNTFLDSSTNNFTITRTGTPTQGTFTPFSQTGWSGYFNGTTDYLSVASNAAFGFGTGDFTVETWAYFNSTPAKAQGIIEGQTTNGFNFYWDGGTYSTNKLTISDRTANQIQYTFLPTINIWYHFAVSRQGTNLQLFVNGISVASATSSTNYVATGFSIGGDAGGGLAWCFPGYLSNMRVVKGTALYTSNFTPSTTPLTAVSGTSLLTLQSNYFKDNSSNNFAITATGTPSIQAFSPFAPAAAYSTATVGGSGYFNGTSDAVSAPSNAALTLGTNSFTLESWIYPTAAGFFRWLQWGTSAGHPNIYLSSNLLTYTNYATSVILTSSIAVVINTWTHIALVRNATTTTIYINGVSGGSAADSNNWGAGIVYVKADGSTAFDGQGYVSNIRIVNGTAVYTTAFTPPTAPLTAVSGTSLLLSGTNAGIYDATAKTVEVTVGTAQASTAQFKFGTSSIALLNTSNANYLTIPASVNRLLTGDFTVEMWSFLPSGSTQSLYANIIKGAATPNNSICASFAGSLKYMVFCGTPAVNIASTVTSNDGVWHHLAFVRSGTTCKFYVDGTAAATTVTTSASFDFGSAGATSIGSGLASDNWTNCYVDELRITKGVARYTANFTPPTAAFPTS